MGGIEIHTYCLIFDFPIRNSLDWAAFRSHILKAKLDNDNPDFHRHSGKKTTFKVLPVVQYGAINGHAALLGVQKGAQLLMKIQIAGLYPQALNMLKRPALNNTHYLTLNQQLNTYTVERLALKIKPAEWLALDALADQTAFLERKITSSLVSFSGSFGYRLTEKIVVRLRSFEVWKELNRYKQKRNNNELEKEKNRGYVCNVKPFKILIDGCFDTNLALPPIFSMGAEKASGYGWGRAEETVKNIPIKELFSLSALDKPANLVKPKKKRIFIHRKV